jgi:hypothetical protein
VYVKIGWRTVYVIVGIPSAHSSAVDDDVDDDDVLLLDDVVCPTVDVDVVWPTVDELDDVVCAIVDEELPDDLLVDVLVELDDDDVV